MIKLIASLAMARDGIDRAIAFGEAVPRLERLKTVMLVGLVAACIVLAAGYINLNSNIQQIEDRQQSAEQVRAEILAYLQDADKDNERIIRGLAGK